MFNIGQFSQLVKVTPRMLRHYEKCGLFHPAKIDRENGYRLYSAKQIPLLLRIVALRDMGFTIDEIKSSIDNFEEENIIKTVLENKQTETENEIVDKNKRIDLIKRTINRISDRNFTTSCHDVNTKSMPRLLVLSLKETVSDYSLQEQLWEKLFDYINNNNLYKILDDTAITIYHDVTPKEKDFEIEVAVVIKERCEGNGAIHVRELEPISHVASVMCEGPYEKILPEGELLLAKWIEENQYSINGSERVYAYKHPYNEKDPNKYQTEIIFPILKNGGKI